MEAILSAAERILQHAGAPALRLSRLLEEVRALAGAQRMDAPRLLELLAAHPHRFRILDPWRGPWRSVVREAAPPGDDAEPWVVAVRDHGDGAAARADDPRVSRLLRASVRWLALTLDPESPGHVLRWRNLALEERELGGAADRAA